MIPITLSVLFVMLYACSSRRECPLETAAEGTTLFVIGYSILGSLTGMLGLYDHRLCMIILLLWVFGRFLSRDETRRMSLSKNVVVDAEAVGLLLVGVVFIIVAQQRFELIEMTQDAGIYPNIAKNLVESGGNKWDLEIQNEVSVKDPAFGQYLFEKAKLPGLYPLPGKDVSVYQFLLAWPSLLALGIALFGPFNYSGILLLLGLVSIYWFHKILSQWLSGLRLTMATAAFAFNPLFIYFARFTTSEGFLLCIVLYLVAIHTRGNAPQSHVLAALFSIGLAHISLFIYLPLLVMYFLWAMMADQRQHLRRVSAISVVFSGSLGLAYFQSPVYFSDIFRLTLGDFVNQPSWLLAGVMGMVVLLFGGLASLVAVSNPLRSNALEQNFIRIAGFSLKVWIVLLLLEGVRTAYLLGWSDYYIKNAELGSSWGERLNYANQGWVGVVHHNFVSIALGTGLSLLAVALLASLSWRRRPATDRTDLFLLTGWVTALTIYFMVRPDTPFNYYASRYFVPVLIPFIILYGFKSLAGIRHRWFYLAVTPVLCFNVVFSGFQAIVPTFQGRHAMVRQLDERLPEGALVASIGRAEWAHFFGANVVRYDLNSFYARLSEDLGVAMREVGVLIRYLQSRSVFVLSDKPISRLRQLDLAVSEIVGTDQVYEYPYQIFYPLSAKKVRMQVFLYEIENPVVLAISEDQILDLDEIAYLSPESFWDSPRRGWSSGYIDVKLPRPWSGSRLRIKTGGGFISFRSASEVSVVINRDKIYNVLLDEKEELVEFGDFLRVERVEISSSTFIPMELGLNNDPRSLGIDIREVEIW